MRRRSSTEQLLPRHLDASFQDAGLELTLAVRPHGTVPCGSSVDPEVGPYLIGLIDFSYCTFSNPICESILAASGAFNVDPSRASPTLRATSPTSSSPMRADGASIDTDDDDDVDLEQHPRARAPRPRPRLPLSWGGARAHARGPPVRPRDKHAPRGFTVHPVALCSTLVGCLDATLSDNHFYATALFCCPSPPRSRRTRISSWTRLSSPAPSAPTSPACAPSRTRPTTPPPFEHGAQTSRCTRVSPVRPPACVLSARRLALALACSNTHRHSPRSRTVSVAPQVLEAKL